MKKYQKNYVLSTMLVIALSAVASLNVFADTFTVDKTLVTIPEGLVIEQYHVEADKYNGLDATTHVNASYYVDIAFDQNDVYMKGFFDSAPDGCLKGTRKDNLITFDRGQYLGVASLIDGSTQDSWLHVMNNLEVLTLEYDETKNTLSKYDYGYPVLVVGENREYADIFGEFSMKKMNVEEGFCFDLVKVPADLNIIDMNITIYSEIPQTHENITKGQMAIDGNEIYMKGILLHMPEAWVKGSIYQDSEGFRINVPMNQYLGLFRAVQYRTYHCWLNVLKYYDDYGYDNCECSSIDFIWNPEDNSISYNWDKERECYQNDTPEFVLAENTIPSSSVCSTLDIYYAFNAAPSIDNNSQSYIENRLNDSKVDISVYSLDGLQRNHLQSGLNIINKNGKMMKVLYRN